MTDEEKAPDATGRQNEAAVDELYRFVGRFYGKVPEALKAHRPGGLSSMVYAFLHDAFCSLRHHLEDPKVPELTWEAPFVELRYPVALDWDQWEKTKSFDASLLGRGLEPEKVSESTTPLRDLEALSKRLASNYLDWAGFTMLSELTNGAGFLKRKDTYEPHVPTDELAEIDKLPEEAAQARFEELFAPYSMGFPFSEDPKDAGSPVVIASGEVNGKPFKASFVLAVLPFMVDEDERRAYFPVHVGLLFEGGAGLPSSWPEEDRRKLWDGALEALRAKEKEAGAEPDTAPVPTWPAPEAVKPQARYLLEGRTRRDKRAGALVGHIDRLALPRKWGSIRQWDELVQEEIDRRLDEFGEDAFVDVRKRTGDPNARGTLLKRRQAPDGKETVELTKDGEEALMASVGHRGFRQVIRDADGARREYLVKRFRAGGGYLEARLSWYNMAWPLVDEGRKKAQEEAEALQERLRQASLFEKLDREDQETLDSRLRLLGSIRDARRVMDAVLDRFGRDGENPLRYPAWELRALLECEKDPDGFRRVRGCLRALQEVRFALEARGAGSGSFRRFGPFLGEVSYLPRGPGEHVDGDFYLSLQEGAVGCLKVFGTSDYKIRDAHKVLTYDWGKRLDRDEKKELEAGFVKGFSALGPYYDVAKGFTAPQSRLRAWIDHSITVRKDYASRPMKAAKVKPSAANADEPRLYGRGFCPLLPEGTLYHGALGHFRKNPERGRTLYGTASSPTRTGGAHAAGLLAEMGLFLRPGTARAHRAATVRLALEAFHAVVEEAYGGIVAARHAEKWLSLEEASKLPEEDLGKRVLWCFFLSEGWRERRGADIEAHHAERHARGEVPYPIRVTESRDVAARSHAELAGDRHEGDVGLASEPLRIRLRATRKDRKLSQAAVGKVFGVSQPTVALWEKGTELDETGKPKGKPIPEELVPLVLRWVDTGEPPTPDELAARKTRRAGGPAPAGPGEAPPTPSTESAV